MEVGEILFVISCDKAVTKLRHMQTDSYFLKTVNSCSENPETCKFIKKKGKLKILRLQYSVAVYSQR